MFLELFFYFLFLCHVHMQVEPLYRFLRLMAQTMQNGDRRCISGLQDDNFHSGVYFLPKVLSDLTGIRNPINVFRYMLMMDQRMNTSYTSIRAACKQKKIVLTEKLREVR